MDEQGILDVFLGYPGFLGPSGLLWFHFGIDVEDLHAVWIRLEWDACVIAYALVVIENFDVSATRQTARLYNPEVLKAI